MYAKISNGTVVQFPYTMDDLRRDNPNTSFPLSPSPEVLAEFGMVAVVVTGAPEHDPATHTAELNGCAFSAERARWETQYLVRPLTQEELAQRLGALQADIVNKTQERLDAFARTRAYDGILSACTYATSSVTKFRTEGQYCVDARDATWSALYDILFDVQTGARPVPTGFADIEADLPPLTWPA